ncbi:MAG: PAS domain-containing protein [bacterium]
MLEKSTLFELLDSVVEPIVFTDNDHIIRYVNPAAERKYRDRGFEDLPGKSLMDCHNPESQTKIYQIYEKLRSGSNEEFVSLTDDGNSRIYARAVRDDSGALLGYYERYEPAAGPDDAPDESC